MPFSLIPFLLLAIPISEIAVFILVGGQIGVLWTFAIILFTAILGSILLRIQGFQVIKRLQEESAAGKIPGKELYHGAMILVAGVLLLTPGFVTDSLGFLLFFPPFRTFLWSIIGSKIIISPLNNNWNSGTANNNKRFEEDVVDLDPNEFQDIDPNTQPKKNSPWNQ